MNSGELVCSVDSPDNYVTCIAGYDMGYVQGGQARILVGHYNGNVHNYVIKTQEIFHEESTDYLFIYELS